MSDSLFLSFEGTPDYPALEHDILRFWDEHNIFDRLREQNAGGEPWRFQDGPITANNPMGVHHAWGRTYKDFFNRFHAMRGRKLRYQNGFDGQGLWVEVEVEKALGFKGKPDIVEFGLENFSRECRARVEKYAARITDQSKRLGYWMDWERSYVTLDDSNIEHIWLFLSKCHQNGWLARDYRVMPWCPRCETSLSQHESADSYKDITHRSVYVQLPIVGCDGEFFLVWTTTPWTLAANVAVALNPEMMYCRVRSEGRVLVLSKGTLQSALKPGYEVLEEVPGSELIGLQYSGPFDDISLQQKMNESTPRRSVAWEDVGEAEGTGIVHIAPGCGAEDFALGQREGLGFIIPVNEGARFLPGCGEVLEGKHGLEDVDLIFEQLEKGGRLYRVQKYKHSYPHCWRCSNELIFYATTGWFIQADAGEKPARQQLRDAAATVKWTPEYAGKRMDEWLANMGDWNISRRRFWGLPLPIYVDSEGNFEVISSRKELRERAVDPAKVDALPELHVPWIDEIKIRSKDGSQVLSRVPDVGDAWLDAGIVPFSTLGYNGDTDNIRMPPQVLGEGAEGYFEKWFPAEFITEMREQVRLWFYSMLFMGVALEGRAPYESAMVYETMLDANGERIQKRLGNGVPYDEAVEVTGADPMRWTFLANPLNKDIRFGYDPRRWPRGKEAAANIPQDEPPRKDPIYDASGRLLTLWNVYGFFVTYANLDKPTLDGNAPSNPANILDRWILARLQVLVADATSAVENQAPSNLVSAVESFVEDLSTWYVRRSRRRFWSKADETASESSLADKADAYSTLHHVLLSLSKIVAPAIPFTAEAMYRNLSRPLANAPESVHLCAWPAVNDGLRDDNLVREVEAVLECVSLGHAARKESKVKVRQPLSKVLVQAPGASARGWVDNWRPTILDELNVKGLELLDDAGDLVTYSLKANLPLLGKKLGPKMKAVRQVLEGADAEEARRIGTAVQRGENVEIEVEGEKLALAAAEVLVSTQQASGYSFASGDGWSVAIDTTLSPELELEGAARDFIRAVQSARKEAGLEVSDRITLLLHHGEPSRVPDIFEAHGDLIQNETLSEELRLVDAAYPEMSEAKIGEEAVRLRVEKFSAEDDSETRADVDG
jgi:isoleucyl-tRNA synthetase